MSPNYRNATRALSSVIAALVLVLLIGETTVATACPMCKESVDQSAFTNSGGGGRDGNGLARGFAWSIYMMLAMPYLLIGAGVFAVWRGIRRSQAPRTHIPSHAEVRHDGPAAAAVTES